LAAELPKYDPLKGDERDALAATTRALASVVPMFGGVIGELLTQGIPGQRIERIVAYIRLLEARLQTLEKRPEQVIGDPERVDLVEEGAFQAARATNGARIEQIASLVAHGLAGDEANIVRRKRLASLLAELDDDELVLLNAYGQSYGTGDYGAWDKVDQPEPTHMQSSQSDIDAEKLYDAGRDHLLRLGLLRKNYSNPRRGEDREFDPRKGDFKHSLEVSYLGRMLLRAIGQSPSFDEVDGD
jgi:hypothetical protein